MADTSDTSFDLIVVGGGPGGYVAAIRARQLGLKTALVEREHLGGVCLNWGCIPTKALLRTAEIYHLMQRAGDFGLSADNVSFDIARVVKRSRQVAGRLNAGVKHLMKKNRVAVFDGHGRLAGKGRLAIVADGRETATLTAPHIILATGARPRTLPGLEPDGRNIWTYKEAMVPEAFPKSLLIVGSGAIGIEFASFYRTLGAEVTVVEMLDRILPAEDEEIGAFVARALEGKGMTLLTGATVAGLEKRRGKGGGIAVAVKTGEETRTLTVEKVILAIGIAGNVEELGLEDTAVTVDRGHIAIGPWCETGEPGVYAIGDVAGPPWLAHKASHEGIICVEKIAGVEGVHPLDTGRIPGCTYCEPQVASVGLTEAAAKAAGHEVRVGRFPFAGNGKAIALGDDQGLVKTVFDAKTGELLGAHMAGPEVTELIQGYGIAKTLETTEADLMHTVFPHPTLSETMHEAVLDAYGRVVHF